MGEPQTRLSSGWGQPRGPRPHIRPPRSTIEVVCVTVVALGLLALLGMTAWWWPQLPAIIPTHFGLDGKPNAYGSKATVLLLPTLLLAMTIGFAALVRFPWIFNYPVTITPENAAQNYRRGRLLLEAVNAVMAAIFAVVQWQTVRVALGAAHDLGPAFSPLAIILFVICFPLLMIGLIVWWSVRSQ
jgi:uncharacterized membrane protein